MTVIKQRLLLVKDIKGILRQSKQLNKAWFSLLQDWINNFNGFVADYNGNVSDENRLLEQLKLLVEQIETLNDHNLITELSKYFEGLYWHAMAENESWDSTKESYFAFKSRHLGSSIDQLILDDPHTPPNNVKTWLSSRIEIAAK